MRKTFAAVSATALMALGMLSVTTPAHAAVPTPSCTANSKTSDDNCTLKANAYTDLVGKQSPNVNVLANDDSANGGVCNVGPLNQSIGTVSMSKDSIGYSDMAIYILPNVVDVFNFMYTTCDGVTHTVQVTPIPYVAPLPLKVHKVHRKGYLQVCNPNSVSATYMYGSLKLQGPDGTKLINAHSCRLVRVHRHTIDWMAYSTTDGYPAGSGTVRHIRLKKGDHAPAPVQTTYKRPIAGAQQTWGTRS